MKGHYFFLLHAKLFSNAEISWSSHTSLRRTMPKHCTVKVWYRYKDYWWWLYLARVERRGAIAELCLLMASSQTSCRKLQGRIDSSDTVQLLNPELFISACLGDSCKAMKLIWGWRSGRKIQGLLANSRGSSLHPGPEGMLLQGRTANTSRESGRKTANLLPALAFGSLFRRWRLPALLQCSFPSNGQRSESPLVETLVSQAVVAGGKGCIEPRVQARSPLPSTGMGSPAASPAALIAGVYPCIPLHLQRNAPVPWWLRERIIAKLNKARQWRQIGKSAEVLVLPESESPAYPLTEALCLLHLHCNSSFFLEQVMLTAWVLPKPAINNLLQIGCYEVSIYAKMCVFVCLRLWFSNSNANYCAALLAVALSKQKLFRAAHIWSVRKCK